MKKLLHIVNTDERRAGEVQHMVIIEGEAGIGKTRLMEEFMDIAEDEHFRFVYGFNYDITFYRGTRVDAKRENEYKALIQY